MNDPTPRLPLLVLDDDVCFPGTEMTVRIAEPAGRKLIRDLMDKDAEERWLGIVLPRPDGGADPLGRPEIFPGGTAVRLVGAHHEPEGFSDVRLAGEFRFEIERELPGGQLYRRAVVRPLGEVDLEEDDPGVQSVRRRLLDLVEGLLPELGEQLELSPDDLTELRGSTPFLLLVNRLAAGLDVPASRKLELLLANLPERGETVLSILESRRYVLDRLRPWRHLAANPELN